jgi:heptosyltransferase-2
MQRLFLVKVINKIKLPFTSKMYFNFLLAVFSLFDFFLSKVVFLVILIFVKLRIFTAVSKSDSIIVVRLDHKIGDMVIFSDFIKKLSLAFPRKKISLVIHKSQKDLYLNCPYAQDIYFFDWGKSLPLSLPFRSIRVLLFVLKNKLYGNWYFGIANRYEEDFHAPFLLYLSGSKERLGYTSRISGRKKWSMFLTDFLFTFVCNDLSVSHEACKNLNVLKSKIPNILCKDIKYETWQTENDSNISKTKLASIGVFPPFNIIALGIGAYENKRIWPSKNYAQLINLISSETRLERNFFLLLGSKDEQYLGDEILSMIRPRNRIYVKNIAGMMNIGETSSILSLSKLFIGNDSGLLHLACANVKSVIEISCHPLNSFPDHANSPIRFGPITELSRIAQPKEALIPCATFCRSKHSHCIKQISSEDVFNLINLNNLITE